MEIQRGLHCTIVSLDLQLAAPFGCCKTLYLKVIIRSNMEYGVMPGLGLCLLQVNLVRCHEGVFKVKQNLALYPKSFI